MKKSLSDERYEDLILLFDHCNPPDSLLNLCYAAYTNFEDSRLWCLASKINQKMGKLDDARKDINQALQLDTLNLEYNYQFFLVLMEQGQTQDIARRINWLFERLPQVAKKELVGFIEVSLESGLFSKLELHTDVIVEILRAKNKKE
jgi:tetratricopeptide (TPR) repeat protein